MQRKLTLLAFLLLSQVAFAIELQPYSSAKITEDQWAAYYAKVREELAGSRSSFSYDAGELENYSEPQTRTNIAFTMRGHKAHPAWVATRIVIAGKKVGVHVFGYYAGDEAAYQDFYRRMNDMVVETLKSGARK